MQTCNMPVISLSGSAYERGRIYGEALRLEIHETVARAFTFVQGMTLPQWGTDPLTICQSFLERTSFRRHIQTLTPDLWDEILGLSEGANLPFYEALFIQIVDEISSFADESIEIPSRCTVFAVRSEDGMFAGQNMDIPRWTEGLQALLRITEPSGDIQSLVFTFAGHIGLNGMNSSGLGVACNSLRNVPKSTDGLPVGFIVRTLLKQKTIEASEEFVLSVPHSLGQAYTMSSPSTALCVETSATAVAKVPSGDSGEELFHTNHALALGNETVSLDSHGYRDSLARLRSITARLGGRTGLSSTDDIKSALSASDDDQFPVCKIPVPGSDDLMGYTAGSSIYKLDSSPCLFLASGPPSETDYDAFAFDGVY